MGDNAALLLRVGFSFSLVLGLMWIAARVLRSRTAGRPTDAVEVLARHQLGRGSAVTVLRIGDRALVLGVTERAITQLGDPITDLTGLRKDAPVATDVIPSDLSGLSEFSEFSDLLPAPRTQARRRSRVTTRATTRAAARTTAPTAAPSAPQAMAGQGALAGSILSPATWRMGMDALRERTVRRG